MVIISRPEDFFGGHCGSEVSDSSKECRVSFFLCVFSSLRLTSIMTDWEPTVTQLTALSARNDVAVCVQQMSESLVTVLWATIGATGSEHPNVLGMAEPDEIDARIAGLNISGVPLNLIQKGYVQKVIHVCRLVAGTETTVDVQKNLEEKMSKVVEEVTKATDETKTFAASQCAAVQLSGVSGPQVRLKDVVSQGSEESVPKISNEEMTHHWDRFKKVYGRDPRPEEECTAEQLTGVDTLLKRDCAPYVDFGVWGPNHHRLPSRDKKLQPDIFNPHAISGNAFAGLHASASTPYAGMLNS